MPKYNRNAGDAWTDEEVKKLKELIKGNTPTRIIGLKLGRTEDAVYDKCKELKLSLKPANQSPYGPRKK